MPTIDNRALFIGVNDYSAFDASMNKQPGTSDLRGSRNDAQAFWHVCRELGIPPENMRILTSPALDPEDLGAPPENVGVATEAAILEGVAWLGAALGGDGRPPGLLTYSGHGDFLEGEGLVLCPSDVTGADLEHAIPFKTIEEALARQRATANLTVVLDCCHSGAATSDPARRVQSLTGRPLPADLEGSRPQLGARELLACEPGGTSWQARFSGVFRGAFSWAVAAVLEQWKPRLEGTSVELDLSYGNLLVRARKLLSALSFEQTPVLRGRPGVATTAFFHSGPGAGDEVNSLAPTARRKGGQLDPDVNHTLSASSNTMVDWVVSATGVSSTPTSQQGYTYDTEYWGLDASFVTAISGIASNRSGSITFRSDTSAGTPASSGFAMPTNSLWTSITAMPGGLMFWAHVPRSETTTEYVVGITFDLTAPARAGEVWQGTMTWYVGVPSGSQAPDYVVGSATMVLSYGGLPASYSSYVWSTMTLPPLTWSPSPMAVPTDTNVPGDSSGDSRTTSLAAVGSAMYATVSDETAITTALYQCTAPAERWHQVPGSAGGAAYATLAAAYGVLYMASQEDDTIYLAVSSTPGSYGWNSIGSTGIRLPAGAGGGFTLAGTDTQLFLAYLAYSGALYGNILNVSTWEGEGDNFASWSPPSAVANVPATGTPALALFNGTLYAAFTTTGATPAVRVFRRQGAAWVETADLSPLEGACPAGLHAPALAAYNGRLFLACLDAGSTDVWLCSTAGGDTWSGYEDLSTRNPAIAAGPNPALAALGSTLFLGWAAVPGGSAQVSTLCTLTPS